jgi:hypothetical protein
MSGAGPAAALDRAVAERTLSPSADAALRAAVSRLSVAAGDSLVGVVFFGSRHTGPARAGGLGAHDVFVVVERYRSFYDGLRRAGLTAKPPAVLAAASRWLPPTQCSLRFADEGVHVKASVIRLDTWVRETSERRHDHFCIGRLFQPARILYFRDEDARGLLLEGLASSHRETWRWSRPWLPPTFDATSYGLSTLRTSMRWEIRPEPAGRADALWEAQRCLQVPVFEALLAELAARGEVAPAPGAPGRYAATRLVGRAERVRLEVYFRWSMARATARWVKHTVTFEGWLDYIAAKAARHTGQPIELTDRERRWPWIFLWGRLVRYLRARDRGGSPP